MRTSTAAAAYAERHDEEKARAAREQGERDNRELDRFLDQIPALAFFWHLQVLGQDDAAYEVLRRVGERTESGQAVGLLAILLYRRGQLGERVTCSSAAGTRPGRTRISIFGGPWSWPNFPTAATKRCDS